MASHPRSSQQVDREYTPYVPPERVDNEFLTSLLLEKQRRDRLLISSDNEYYHKIDTSNTVFISPETGRPELVEHSQDTPPGKIVLHLSAPQQAIYDNPSRILGMFAGSQGGKTSFSPWWLYKEIRSKGSGDYLAVTTNYDLFKLNLLPKMLNTF